jgi:hypothetical protein
MKTTLFGISVSAVTSRFVQWPVSARPGIGGMTASAPVATTIASVSSERPSASTRRGPVISPRALMTVIPRFSYPAMRRASSWSETM